MPAEQTPTLTEFMDRTWAAEHRVKTLEAELLAAQERVRVLEASESRELAHEKAEKDRYAGLWVAAQEQTQLLGRTTQNLHAELQAAQEREARAFDDGVAAVWDEPVCSVCAQNHDRDESSMCEGGEPVTFREWAEGAQEREKALRDRVEAVREQMHGPLREKLWEALAGSPSERPGSTLGRRLLDSEAERDAD